MDKILTVTDVAQILKVKPITAREMFREKRLRGFKLGKAWRTTETILKEDIAALASGASPADLPQPQPPKVAAPKPKPVAAPPPPKPEPAPKKAAKPKKDKPAKAKEKPEEEDGDDTQGMLF